MKNIIIALVSATFFYACQPSSTSEQTNKSEETSPVAKVGFYGETIDEYNIDDITVLHHKLAVQDSAMSKMHGIIIQTCQKKGCWMKVAMSDGVTLRVTFKDYGFFVPKTGMEGRQVVFEGLAKIEEASVETLQHYAKDGGTTEEEITAITEVKREISFVASGVMIKGVEE